jgi:predicted CXXCH cytochrome family protein
VHGRTSGLWSRDLAGFKRLNCVSCHNPHSPKFPALSPAPGPHPMRPARTPRTSSPPAH